MHFGKWEMKRQIENMEVEYSLLMTWLTQLVAPSNLTSQWGHNIKVMGLPQKVSGSKVKSFLVGTFGFTSNGELTSVTNYLRSHGSFELEQVGTTNVCLR